MKHLFHHATLASLALLIGTALLLPAVALASSRSPLLMDGKSSLYRQVVTKPGTRILAAADPAAAVVDGDVPAFQTFYIYSMQTSGAGNGGWFEVGTNARGAVKGWIREDDAIPWNQNMCMFFAHPEGRGQVLMFDTLESLVRVADMPKGGRKGQVDAYLETIRSGQVAAGFPIVSLEPGKAIDIRKHFYLMPVLDYKAVRLDNREARALRVAAVPRERTSGGETSDIRKNKEYIAEATKGSMEISAEQLAGLAVDVVWVMDTTVSMKPYIQAVRDVVRNVSRSFGGNPEAIGSLKLGIWGYRDPVEKIPGIGYTTYNYTPELLPVGAFLDTMREVDVTQVDSIDYPEDVFSGLRDAVAATKWTPGAMRFIILVGDAPGHELGNPLNASGLDENMLRKLADDMSVYVFAVQVKSPKAKQYHARAAAQFGVLSRNKGMENRPALWNVDSNNARGFADISTELSSKLMDLARQARGGVLPQRKADGAGKNEASALVDGMINAALVEWVGKVTDAKPPRNVTAWLLDKDLVVSDAPSVQVRFLVNKRQLNTLTMILTDIINAGRLGQMSGDDFFETLQAVSASAARTPDQIGLSSDLAMSGFVPEFLVGLPYHSRIMDMSNELWASWSIDEQDSFLREMDARIEAYRTLHDSPEGWIQLHQGDDPEEYVYPISLDLLP